MKTKIALIKLPHHVARLKIGDRFEGKGPEGESRMFRIVEKNNDNMTIDGNHPLAGQTLQLSATIVEVLN